MAKAKKIDRNRQDCKSYKVADKARTNKLAKMQRTIKAQPENLELLRRYAAIMDRVN